MTHFIETDRGYVNADHVKTIRESATSSFELLDKKGNVLGNVGQRLDQNIWPIVPAAPGSVATWFWYYTEEDRPPTAEDICTRQYQIIAWRITPGYVEPVFIEERFAGAEVLIHQPDGSLISPGDFRFDDLEAAKAGLVDYWLNDWQVRHQHDEELAES